MYILLIYIKNIINRNLNVLKNGLYNSMRLFYAQSTT